MCRPSRHHGFTLVEILVCLTIVGTLLGLLLPAVSGIREQARVTACRNNARHIGLTLHALATGGGRIPANRPVPWTVDAVRRLDPGLLPPGSASDRDVAWDLMPAAKVSVATFLCPSAPPMRGEERAISNHGLNALLPGLRVAAVTDGLAHTLLTAEIPSESAAPWTWGPLADVVNIGSAHHGLVNVTLADGSTRGLDRSIRSEILRGLLAPDDGMTASLE